MARKTHKANVHGAAVGNGGLADQMAARTRQDGTTAGGEGINSTSIFDPVLAELHYRWFCPPGGTILDPFAGGSVRGIVAGKLGRLYTGIDLRQEQVEANRLQAEEIMEDADALPIWECGDSYEVLQKHPLGKAMYDYIFTCPPYHDLEVYSSDERDISNMDYPHFMQMFSKIMFMATQQLREDRFLTIVLGDVRDKKTGAYRGLPAHCVSMMQRHGVKLWNEQIIVTPAGSLPARTKLGFTTSRKTGRSHQVAYTFLKGDGKLAAKACGECEFGKNDPLGVLDDFQGDDPLAGLGEVL